MSEPTRQPLAVPWLIIAASDRIITRANFGSSFRSASADNLVVFLRRHDFSI